MAIRTLVIIMLAVSLLVVVYGIFQGGFPDVTERVLEFIDIPDQDPTPDEIGTAKRLEQIFSSYNTIANSLSRIESAGQGNCYTEHESLQYLRSDEKGALTLRFVNTGSGSELALVRGSAEANSYKILKSQTFSVEACRIDNDETIARFNQNLYQGKNPLEELDGKVQGGLNTGMIWLSETRTAILPDATDAGAQNPLHSGETRGTIRDYKLADDHDSYYVFKFGDKACFAPSGDMEAWFGTSGNKLMNEYYGKIPEVISEDYKCKNVN